MKKKALIHNMIALLLCATLLVVNVPVLADKAPLKQNVMSPWAIAEVYNAETMGLLPDMWVAVLNDYTKPITGERANELLSVSNDKLSGLGLKGAKSSATFTLTGEVNREQFVEAVYALLTQYEPDQNNDKVAYLTDKSIIKGDGNSLVLKRACSEQEALIILARSVQYIYDANELGGKGFAWTIKNKENTVHLLGSVHLANASVHPFNKKLRNAFVKADKLVMEIDIIKMAQNQAQAMSAYVYQDGTTLESQIGKDNYELASQFLQSAGISIDLFKNYKPWAFNIVLQQIKENTVTTKKANLKINAKYGIDMWFNNVAYLMQKPVVELETVESQIALFDSQKKEDQVAELEKTLQDVNNEEETTEMMKTIGDILKTWKNGNRDEFLKVFDVEKLEETEFGKNLLEDRDKGMADKIDAMLKEDGKNTYFVVVGSGHCFSKTNIRKRLEEKGYTVYNFYE